LKLFDEQLELKITFNRGQGRREKIGFPMNINLAAISHI
jgi:hypothetical protein